MRILKKYAEVALQKPTENYKWWECAIRTAFNYDFFYLEWFDV